MEMHAIGVRECLAKRGIPIDNTCPICNSETETIVHALRDCRSVQPIWHHLGVHRTNNAFFDQELRSWLKSNATSKSTHNPKGIPWNVLFLITIWSIWKQRNQAVFNNKSPNPSLVKQITTQATEFIHYVYHPTICKRMTMKQIRREVPERGRLKLNTDGAANRVLGVAGGGGLIRDEYGNWVVGFSRRIGITNSFMAEAWALRDGLILCDQMKLSDVIVELDSKALVDAFNNLVYANSVISPLFEDCKQLASQIPRLCIRHIYREANKCADKLANIGLNQSLDFVIHSCLPVDLLGCCKADCQGLYSNRLCCDPPISF